MHELTVSFLQTICSGTGLGSLLWKMVCVNVKQILRRRLPCIWSLCHSWVSVCVLLKGRAQEGRCIFTTSSGCLEQKLCCRKIMWLCEFHPCHVIRAQGRVWEVLSRSVRFLLPREAGCESERRRWRQTCGGTQVRQAESWWKQAPFKTTKATMVGRFLMWLTPKVPSCTFLSLWIWK